MKRFVVIGHKAATSGDFKLDDMAGGAGRLDILLRCINSSFFLSHGIRRDAEVYLVLQGEPNAPRTIRINGSEVRYLNPDERSTGQSERGPTDSEDPDQHRSRGRAGTDAEHERVGQRIVQDGLHQRPGIPYHQTDHRSMRSCPRQGW